MRNLACLKLGAVDGAAAAIVLVFILIAAIAVIGVVVVNILKAVKEHKDELEDKQEDEFFAEYGVSGEELRLNQQLAEMREKLISNKRVRQELLDEQHIVVVRERKEIPVEVPVAAPAEPQPEPVQEPVATPVEEPLPEPAPEPVVEQEEPTAEPIADEPVKAEEPVAEPAPEPAPEQKKEPEPTPVSVEELTPVKKEENWSRYDGEYEGVYYDPEDACYYEGTPSPELAKRLEEYQAELNAKSKKKKKAVIVKKVVPPFLALKTPKNERKEPQKQEGFDLSVIYGKYVIEHADKPDGTTEYYYTLYTPQNKIIYESSNYSALEYCKRAIPRFQTHVLVGDYSIEAENGKFFFMLRRKTYVHKGIEQNSFEDANALIAQVKSYAQTDIIREQ